MSNKETLQGYNTRLSSNNITLTEILNTINKLPTLDSNVGRLPEDYQEVEYIESTGTQYIDTGVIATQNIGFEIEFETSNEFTLGTDTIGCILGVRGASYRINAYLLTTETNPSNGDVGGAFVFGTAVSDYSYKNITTAANMSNSTKLTISFKNLVFTDALGNNTTLNSSTISANQSIPLCCLLDNKTYTRFANMKLYSCKFYDGDTLIRELIPCYRISDGIIGLYDIANDVFYTNSGTGTFVKGTDVETLMLQDKSIEITENGTTTITADEGYDGLGNVEIITNIDTGTTASRLPAGYQEVEHIESTGTQYIDTGVLPNTNTRLDIDFCYTENSTTTLLFGSRKSWNQQGFYVGTKSNVLGNNFWIEFGNKYTETGLPISDTNRHTISFGNQFYYDNTLYYTFDTTLSGYQNIILFGSFEGEQNKVVPSASRLYSCQIYENESLIRNFVPCYRIEDDIVGLYDLVNDVFYANGGTGTFVKGNNVSANNSSSPMVDGETLIFGSNASIEGGTLKV